MTTNRQFDPSTPFDVAVEKFLGDIAATKTQSSYRTGTATFNAYLSELIKQPLTLAALDSNDLLIDFWRWLRKRKPAGTWRKDSRKLSDQSIQSYLAATIAFLSFLNDEEALPDSFSLDRARGRLKRARRENRTPYPTRQPDQRLPLVVMHYDRIDLPPAKTDRDRAHRLRILRDRAIVHVLYSTAGRISEVTKLTRNDVGDGRSESAIVIGKGSKSRTLFFTPEARQAIKAYINERKDSDRALFVSHSRRQGGLGAATLWRVVKVAAHAEGLHDIHPHDFRHMRASQMLSEGARLEEVQEILGHADISTTRKIYAAFSRAAVKEAFEAYRLSPEDAMKKAESEGKG